jgi:hypothetical protein
LLVAVDAQGAKAMTNMHVDRAHLSHMFTQMTAPLFGLLRRGDGLTEEQRQGYQTEFEQGLGRAPQSNAERTERLEVLASKVEPQIWRRSASV